MHYTSIYQKILFESYQKVFADPCFKGPLFQHFDVINFRANLYSVKFLTPFQKVV